jgi:hypothetical protein
MGNIGTNDHTRPYLRYTGTEIRDPVHFHNTIGTMTDTTEKTAGFMVFSGMAKYPNAIGRKSGGYTVSFSGVDFFAVNNDSQRFLFFYIENRMFLDSIHIRQAPQQQMAAPAAGSSGVCRRNRFPPRTGEGSETTDACRSAPGSFPSLPWYISVFLRGW